jgi:prophage regulatory protein
MQVVKSKEVTPSELVDSFLYKLVAVKAITSLSTATIYRMLKTGDFPKPVRIGPKIVRWRGCDLRNFINR